MFRKWFLTSVYILHDSLIAFTPMVRGFQKSSFYYFVENLPRIVSSASVALKLIQLISVMEKLDFLFLWLLIDLVIFYLDCQCIMGKTTTLTVIVLILREQTIALNPF